MTEDKRPKVNSESQKQLDRAQEKLDAFEEQVRSFNPLEVSAPTVHAEPQVKLSTKEVRGANAEYLKPIRSINRTNTEKAPSFWNEKWASHRKRDMEYVLVTAQNNEVIGEAIEMWTSEYGCDPAHFWRIPVNRPVWIPRLVARKIANCRYHKLIMEDRPISSTEGMTYYGAMTVTQTKERLSVTEINNNLSVGF